MSQRQVAKCHLRKKIPNEWNQNFSNKQVFYSKCHHGKFFCDESNFHLAPIPTQLQRLRTPQVKASTLIGQTEHLGIIILTCPELLAYT